LPQIKPEVMKKIDLKGIMNAAGLKNRDLDALLFPEHKHRDAAMQAVKKGALQLRADQIVKLAEFLKVPIDMLFTDTDWEMSAPKDQRVITFKNHDYTAEYNLDTQETTVYKGLLMVPEKLSHTGGVELTQYLSNVTDLVIKYSSK
jgi:hypothetical protein